MNNLKIIYQIYHEMQHVVFLLWGGIAHIILYHGETMIRYPVATLIYLLPIYFSYIIMYTMSSSNVYLFFAWCSCLLVSCISCSGVVNFHLKYRQNTETLIM